MTCHLLHHEGKEVRIDEKGYLLNYGDWRESLAVFMAESDGLELTSEHWAILRWFRTYFEEYEIDPPMRVVVRWCKENLGEEKGSSRFLYRLFPDGPILQASRYGGLPRPASCI